MSVRCFWLEPIGRTRLTLRCYADGPCPSMPGPNGYHNAHTPLFDVVERKVTREDGDWIYNREGPQLPGDVFPTYDWPTACDCGFVFAEPSRQVFSDRLLRRVDTGEIRGIREWAKVPGAMWNLEWLVDHAEYRGPDGRSLSVVLPNQHEWYIDSRASNCTMPTDTAHKCWVRHGIPPVITVDKNGLTCAAGAGSIQAGDYHGFLRNGVFEP